MTKENTMEIMGYKVEKTTALTGHKYIAAEYTLTGKRGAKYVTWRWNINGKPSDHFQIMRQNDAVFVKIKGNTFLPVELFEEAK
jgi:hypothetical protein